VPRPARPQTPPADDDAEDLEATRFSVSSRRSTGDAAPAQPATTIELTSGERVRVGERTLLGRNPQQPVEADRGEPAALLPVEDPTRSVSKTHLELVPTPDGLRVTDLGSTNGSAVITPAGEVHELAPGTPFTVTTGWAVQAGDVRFTVVGPVEA
jgi:pSer/pThr/pTyr-binding forkhead associated (FHA) protein